MLRFTPDVFLYNFYQRKEENVISNNFSLPVSDSLLLLHCTQAEGTEVTYMSDITDDIAARSHLAQAQWVCDAALQFLTVSSLYHPSS